MADRIQRIYEGKLDEDIFARLVTHLRPVARRYDLVLDIDESNRTVDARRTGLRADLRVAQSTVSVNLEFAFLLKPLTGRVMGGVQKVLDDLFKS